MELLTAFGGGLAFLEAGPGFFLEAGVGLVAAAGVFAGDFAAAGAGLGVVFLAAFLLCYT